MTSPAAFLLPRTVDDCRCACAGDCDGVRRPDPGARGRPPAARPPAACPPAARPPAARPPAARPPAAAPHQPAVRAVVSAAVHQHHSDAGDRRRPAAPGGGGGGGEGGGRRVGDGEAVAGRRRPAPRPAPRPAAALRHAAPTVCAEGNTADERGKEGWSMV